MPAKPLAELVGAVEKAEASLRAARAAASAEILAHISSHNDKVTAHQAEIEAAKVLLLKAGGEVPEDSAESGASFSLTGTRIGRRSAVRVAILTVAGLVIVYGLVAHLF